MQIGIGMLTIEHNGAVTRLEETLGARNYLFAGIMLLLLAGTMGTLLFIMPTRQVLSCSAAGQCQYVEGHLVDESRQAFTADQIVTRLVEVERPTRNDRFFAEVGTLRIPYGDRLTELRLAYHSQSQLKADMTVLGRYLNAPPDQRQAFRFTIFGELWRLILVYSPLSILFLYALVISVSRKITVWNRETHVLTEQSIYGLFFPGPVRESTVNGPMSVQHILERRRHKLQLVGAGPKPRKLHLANQSFPPDFAQRIEAALNGER